MQTRPLTMLGSGSDLYPAGEGSGVCRPAVGQVPGMHSGTMFGPREMPRAEYVHRVSRGDHFSYWESWVASSYLVAFTPCANLMPGLRGAVG